MVQKRSTCLCLLILFFSFSGISISASENWILKREVISQRYDNFDCHSSSLIETVPGQLCAVWKGGPGLGTSNIDIKENVGIWISIFDHRGWSCPYEVVSAPNSVCWNPVLCKSPEGELLLFYRIGLNPRNVVSFLKRSYDGGMTWSDEEILPAGIVGPTKSAPLFASDGSWIVPSSVEVGAFDDPWKATACWIEISPDHGKTWKKVGPIEHPFRKFGVIEPALFLDQNQNIKMLCRDRANKIGEQGYLWTCSSADGGYTWSSLTQTALPNPDSGIDVTDLGNGTLFLFYNHSHTQRYPLNVAISMDGGESWSKPFCLSQSGEFPAATLASNGLIHLTFAIPKDRGQRMIQHVIIDPDRLIAKIE